MLDGFINLLEKMLCFDASKHITAQEALNHSWFRVVPELGSNEWFESGSVRGRRAFVGKTCDTCTRAMPFGKGMRPDSAKWFGNEGLPGKAMGESEIDLIDLTS